MGVGEKFKLIQYQAMQTIRIFLASSAELDADKEQLELFISRKNKDFRKKRIFLELSTWKDFISAMTEEHSQEKYTQYIKSCDIALFLFHSKLGRYTKQEFDAAREAFLRSTGKFKTPFIYTFFKNEPAENPEITHLKTYIDNLEHFYDTYHSTDDLLVKLNRQLDQLEKMGFFKNGTIDVPVIIRYAVYYFLLPLLVLGGAIMTYYFYQPTDLTVKIKEVRGIPYLPFEEGSVSLTYGTKTETLTIKDEVIFKQIPSKYKRNDLNLKFSSNGFVPVDTMIMVKDLVELPVRRDNSLGEIFGMVKDENNVPLKDVAINVKGIETTTDENGNFKILLPIEKQSKEQQLTAFKKGYQLWDRSFPVIENWATPIVLVEIK